MERSVRCPNCGYENDPDEVVCMGCGWPLADDPGPAERG
ncbi:MAG TPA: zinc-ribbon domain-containing protein [Actinomycetota bacterium]|nr:zinc-ribbon domain-containing protein [Actinomycetota bacterium]